MTSVSHCGFFVDDENMIDLISDDDDIWQISPVKKGQGNGKAPVRNLDDIVDDENIIDLISDDDDFWWISPVQKGQGNGKAPFRNLDDIVELSD